MDYEERITQEIEAMKKKRAFVEQTTDNNALRCTIDELCVFTVKKQMSNQMHTPDGYGGITEIKTPPFVIACDAFSGECNKFVKDCEEHWSITTAKGTTLPTSTLPTEALRAAATALLDTIAGIHAWEQEWM